MKSEMSVLYTKTRSRTLNLNMNKILTYTPMNPVE